MCGRILKSIRDPVSLKGDHVTLLQHVGVWCFLKWRAVFHSCSSIALKEQIWLIVMSIKSLQKAKLLLMILDTPGWNAFSLSTVANRYSGTNASQEVECSPHWFKVQILVCFLHLKVSQNNILNSKVVHEWDWLNSQWLFKACQ